MSTSNLTRFASGTIFDQNRLDLLLWFEKIVLPQHVIQGSGLDGIKYDLLRESNIMVSDQELIIEGLLKAQDIFNGESENQEISFGGTVTFDVKSKVFTSWSPKAFCNYLRQGSIIAPSIYEIEKDFINEYHDGKSTCLGVILKNLPKIDFEQTDFRQFLNFIKNDETIKLRRRLFNWQNEISRDKLSAIEIQELLATRLDDYKTWIDTAKMKHSTRNLESVLIIFFEVAENLVRLKPSKAVKALFDFRKRELDLTQKELNAPGRELAFIHNAQEVFSNE